MSAHIPPGFTEVSIPFTHALSSRRAFVTFGIDSSGALVVGSELADAMLGQFQSQYADTIDANVTVGPVYVVVGQDGPSDLPYTGTLTFQGGRAGEAISAAIAAMYDKTTARPGRRGRGRMYLPWVLLDTEVSETGQVAAGSITTLNTKGAGWLAALAAGPGPFPMVLLHGGIIPLGVVPDIVTSLTTDPIVGVQKRRLNRGG